MPSASAALDDLVAVATRLLAEPVTLADELSFSDRAVVARLRRGDGQSVIAKQSASGRGLARELAAYATLPASSRAELVAEGDGVLLLEDLGTGPSLADLLMGTDPVAATAGVTTMAAHPGRWSAFMPPPSPAPGSCST